VKQLLLVRDTLLYVTCMANVSSATLRNIYIAYRVGRRSLTCCRNLINHRHQVEKHNT